MEPLIDYMAKDYASFRQALIDLIPSLVPDWTERHEADLGITLLELLAYAADQLSYYQDAVANEAYLKTARQRISVRRHANLIDYRMHDGASARAFIHFAVIKKGLLPKGTQVLTQIDRPLGSETSPPGSVILADLEKKKQAICTANVVFETMRDVHLHEILNEIQIHTWGDERCCLPRGATSADLAGDLTEVLHKGDFLLFEEVKGLETGQKEDANLRRRQVVMIKEEPQKLKDSQADITRVTWDDADRLQFPLCISFLRNGELITSASIARGNLVLADHGCEVGKAESHPGPEAPAHEVQRRAHGIRLNEGPLSFRIEPDNESSVSQLMELDPHKAKPQIVELKMALQDWSPVMPNLLNSGPFDPHFVVENDSEGRAAIRFGDGEYGMAPTYNRSNKSDSSISITYRVGVGRIGNVGPGSFAHIIKPENCENFPDISSLSNPLPAWGGMDPEPMEKAKLIAPAAFHAELCRAVTEEDYARIAERHPKISKAIATFRWTGSWHTVFVTVDPRRIEEVDFKLKNELKEWIASYSQAGYDIEIDGPIYVPLEIEFDICVDRDYFRSNVEEALRFALSDQINPDGSLGFFHPDNFTFGQPLYISQLYHAMEAIDGVDFAMVKIFQRYGKPSKSDLKSGRIPLGRLEIVQMNNDRNFPENGVLRLNMLGGK